MNKPSDMLDIFDKITECRNFFIDMNNQEIRREIEWLITNYNNIHELRIYFLRFINPNNFAYYMQWVTQLNALSEDKLQRAAELRANALYSNLKHKEQQKIDSKPLKLIAEELKKYDL